MKIVIVGCGRVGAAIAETYDRNGQQVLILDISTAAFDRLPSSFGGEALRGDGTDEDVLRRAGAEGADAFLAVTEGDNRNVMAAQLATEALGIGRVIAKINDPVRAAAYSELGIATLCRTGLMMDAIDGYLGLPTSGLPGMLAPTGTHHDPSHGLLATVGSAFGSSGPSGSTASMAAGGSVGSAGASGPSAGGASVGSSAGGGSGSAGTRGSAGPGAYGGSGTSSATPIAGFSGTVSGGGASTGAGPAGATGPRPGAFPPAGSAGATSPSGASGGNGASRFFRASRLLGGYRGASSSPASIAAPGAPVHPAVPATRREV